jgi:DNA-binding response OmpR family regulator
MPPSVAGLDTARRLAWHPKCSPALARAVRVQMTQQRKAILIVDDDARFLDAIREVLELEGFQVHVACDAYEAVRELREVSFAAVLSDVMMPGNGHTVVEYVHAIQPHTPVVVISGCDSTADRQRVLQNGASSWLTKPVAPDHLRGVLRQITH